MAGPALFYLGLANYQLGKQTLNKAQVREAVIPLQAVQGCLGAIVVPAVKLLQPLPRNRAVALMGQLQGGLDIQPTP